MKDKHSLSIGSYVSAVICTHTSDFLHKSGSVNIRRIISNSSYAHISYYDFTLYLISYGGLDPNWKYAQLLHKSSCCQWEIHWNENWREHCAFIPV